MESKTLVWIGLSVGSIAGGYLGGLLDHGNLFGPWSLITGTLGAFLGIYAGYKLGNM